MFKERHKARRRRHSRIRKKVVGTAERPRLAVYRSLNHISAQLIDDETGRTLVGLSTGAGVLKTQVKRGNKEGAQALGKLLAEQAKAQKINQAVFDRGGYIYHGRVRAVAEAAREAGLKI